MDLAKYPQPVNFFGHAVLAHGLSSEPDFILGSMLPDLRAMAGIRADFEDGGLVSAGIRLHHQTDDLYHNHPLVKARMAREAGKLEALGLHHRQAQAVSHMGLELVTDGILAGRKAETQVFRRAIARAREARGPIESALATEADVEAWRRVAERLASGDFPGRYREPEFVATRFEIVLSRRPRLSLDARHRDALTVWCRDLGRRVGTEVQAVMVDLEGGLARQAVGGA